MKVMQNTTPLEEKRIFVITSPDEKRANTMSQFVQAYVKKSQVYYAKSGSEAQFKVENTPPHVLITDVMLPNMSGEQLIESILADTKNSNMAFVILSPIPDEEILVDLVVTGQVQFVHRQDDQEQTLNVLNKALNFVADGENNQYQIKFVGKGEILIEEGAPPGSIYILKEGRMVAYKTVNGEEVVLGHIEPGEFVGEMARFVKDRRSASVRAMGECELIEIPDDSLDKVLFSKPSWTKALFQTLSKRLKQSNEKLIEKEVSG